MKAKKNRVAIYDTTLRDGAQGEGISFSSAGKIRVAKCLDEFGVDYIEGGFAASNPKDMEFFLEIKKEKLKHARIAAFGSHHRLKTSPTSRMITVKAMGNQWDIASSRLLKSDQINQMRQIRFNTRCVRGKRALTSWKP